MKKKENNYVLYVCVYTIGPVVMVIVVVVVELVEWCWYSKQSVNS